MWLSTEGCGWRERQQAEFINERDNASLACRRTDRELSRDQPNTLLHVKSGWIGHGAHTFFCDFNQHTRRHID